MRLRVFFKTRLRNNFPHVTHRRVFQDSRGFARLRITHNQTALWIGRFSRYAGQFQSEAVSESHMPVESADKYRSIRCEAIDELFGGKRRTVINIGPPLVVPVATGDPTSGREFLGKPWNTIEKLLRRLRIARMDTGQLEPAARNACIVKARQRNRPCASIRRVAAPAVPDLFTGSRHHVLPVDGNSLGSWFCGSIV